MAGWAHDRSVKQAVAHYEMEGEMQGSHGECFSERQVRKVCIGNVSVCIEEWRTFSMIHGLTPGTN